MALSRKTEILIGFIIAAGLLAFIGVNIFNTLFDSDSMTDKIAEAISKDDIEYLKGHIRVEGMKEDLSTEELELISRLLRENNYHLNLEDSIDETDKSIYVEKKGREKLIFDKYILVLKPYKLSINTNIAGSKVYIDEREVATVTKDLSEIFISDLTPGIYTVKILYEGDYAKIEKTEEIELFDKFDNQVYTDIELDAGYIDVYSNRSEAILYIDGKNSGISLSDTYTLGPLSLEDPISLSARAKIHGATYESDTVELDGYSSDCELYIDYEEHQAAVEPKLIYKEYQGLSDVDSINILMDNYQYGLIEAVNYNNYDIVSPYIEWGSPLETAQKKLVINLNAKGTSERLIDYTIHSIDKISENLFELSVSENHNIYYSNGKVELLSNKWIYTAVKYGDDFYLRNLRK